MARSVTFVAIQPVGNRNGLLASLVLEEVAGAVNGIKGSIAFAAVGAVAIMKAAMDFFIVVVAPKFYCWYVARTVFFFRLFVTVLYSSHRTGFLREQTKIVNKDTTYTALTHHLQTVK